MFVLRISKQGVCALQYAYNSFLTAGPGLPHYHPAGNARQLTGHRERPPDQDSQKTKGILFRGQSRTRR